jgi:ATP-dependent protease ClpP protease subunit
MIALCDEINLAIDYYQYQRFILQIDSVGGSATALEYYLQQLVRWRQRNVCIGTQALTRAYSAAAIMLSLGDIGHRWAYSTSRLLYHNPRVVTEGSAIDAHRLIDMYRELTLVNDHMVNQLASHIYENKILRGTCSPDPNQLGVRKILAVRADPLVTTVTNDRDVANLFVEVDCGDKGHLGLDQIKVVYQTLNQQDIILSAEQARDMLLIDSIFGLSSEEALP